MMGERSYRPFTEKKFGQIGFLAISQSEHVRGCGMRLMARTKRRAKKLSSVFTLVCG